MAGFDDMAHRHIQIDDPEKAARVQAFQADVYRIFPDAPASRLARACGGVAHRTAQKWLNGNIYPIPDDVREYVETQKAALSKTDLEERLAKLMGEFTDAIDREVLASQIAHYYEDFAEMAIR